MNPETKDRLIMEFRQYDCKVDRQGRTALPLRLRQKVGTAVALSCLPEDRFISGYPAKAAKKPFDEEIDAGLTIGNIFERPLDGRGRFTIPAILREIAEIKSVVIITTAEDYFQLWSEKQWKSDIDQARADFARIQRLSGGADLPLEKESRL